MEQHALPLFHAYRIAVSQHATIDRKIPIAHFVAVGHPLRERGFHRRLARSFEFLYSRGGGQKILRHVTALTEKRFEFFEYEEYLPVVATWLMPGLDIHRPNLPVILPGVEIGTRSVVRVIETKTR